MSIAYRSFYSIAANLIRSVISFLSVLLIARGLGPEEYGVFAFLLASFAALRSLLDMGSSSAFFSFASKRVRSRNFFGYYAAWLFFQFAAPALLIGLVAPDAWIEQIWQGENRGRVLLAFVAVFVQQQLWGMVTQIGDSQRLTVKVQLLNVGVAGFHLLIICGLFLVGSLTIDLIYTLVAVEMLVLVAIAYRVFPVIYASESESPRKILREYWLYCLPLIPYAWLGVASGFADTWLLQRYGGAVEQAYYSIAAQFAAISLIATTSVLRILWKEVAEANALGDRDKVYRIHERTSRILFMLGAIISGFLIPWAEEIIQFLLGDAYVDGAMVLALMFLYPIYQALGQINGTMFYALELTKPYVILSLVQMVISMTLVYFLLASPDAVVPGLGLSSMGLALKMVVIQFIGVNVSIWWLSRHQGWPFSIGYQFVGIGSLLVVGYAVHGLFGLQLPAELPFLLRGALAAVLYGVITLALAHSFPNLIGSSHAERDYFVKRVMKNLRGRTD